MVTARFRVLCVLALCGACNAILGNETGIPGESGNASGATSNGGKSTAGMSSGGSESANGGEPNSGRGGVDATGGTAGPAQAGDTEGGAAGSGSGGAASCSAGEGQCNNGAPVLCETGQWVAQPACDQGLDTYCYEGRCLPCSPGSFKCDGNTVQECSGLGAWETKMTCTNPKPICNAGNGSCTDIGLVGGFTTPGSIAAAQIRVQGEFLLQPRACDAGKSVCVRGGFLP